MGVSLADIAGVQVRQGTDLAGILDKSVALQVSFSKLGITKHLPSSAYEVKSNKAWTHATKKLFDSPAYSAVRGVESEFKAWLRDIALPSPLGHGIYMVPMDLVEMCEAKIKEVEAKWAAAVDLFITAYPSKITEAQQELGENFDPVDYPGPQQARLRFVFETSYIHYGTPDSLPDRMKMRELDKQAAKIKSFADDIRSILYTNLLETVEWMGERLNGTRENGSPKIIREDKLDNIRQMLAIFESRNLVGDAELNAMADQAKKLLDGVDRDALAASPEVRDSVREGFAGVQKMLADFVIDKPIRRIRMSKQTGEVEDATQPELPEAVGVN